MRLHVYFLLLISLCWVAACQSDEESDTGVDTDPTSNSDPANSDPANTDPGKPPYPTDTANTDPGKPPRPTDGPSTDTGEPPRPTDGPSTGDQCTVDADCQLASDCCGCSALPVDEDIISCLMYCEEEDKPCALLGVPSDKPVLCSRGNCVLNINCDLSQVLCNMIPPECSEGWVLTVQGMCYGPCIPKDQCPHY
ncbi:MAG: hypothetical protein M0R76_04340 [Proteobacteria bacterium]|nr:hypothetical protein [Pseudomonadota bacterium]